MAPKKPPLDDEHVVPTPPTYGDSAEPIRKPGSKPGNQKALKHGVNRAMKGIIRKTPVNGMDEYDIKARTRARAVFAGRLGDPRKQSYQVNWAGVLRTRARLDLRGWFTPSGEQKEAAKSYYELSARCEKIESDLAREGAPSGIAKTPEDAKRMAAALVGQFPQAFEFRICTADGSDFAFGTGMDAPRRALALDPVAADALALPASPDAPPANVARRGTLLPPHPADVREPQAEPVAVTPKTIEAETSLQRAWRLGQAPDGSEYD